MNDRFLEDLKARVDIREIVGKYTSLKKAGKSWRGRSPFRSERTPSFFVDPEKNLWYDFGASEGGDVISFVEKIENYSFFEAMEMLAQQVGMEIPISEKKNFGPKKEVKQNQYDLHESVAKFFEKQLSGNKKVQKYLHDRGITNETIKEWRIGFGGDAKNGVSNHLRAEGFTSNAIVESGVAFLANDQSLLDRFEGRVMVSIFEARNGKVIAFSGRDIAGNSKAKYKNSPENPLYHKSSVLFGLDRARKSIRDTQMAVLVEGNFDVISAHQAGLTNVIATCGTSLTEDHVRILGRVTPNMAFAFDSDAAGKKATMKGVEMALRFDMNPFVIAFEDAKDIDEALQKDVDSVRKKVRKPVKALDFFLEKFWNTFKDKGIEGEKQFLDYFFYYLKLVSRPVEVDFYIEELAKKMRRAKGIIKTEFQNFASKKTKYQTEKFVPENKISLTREESFLGFWQLFPDIFPLEKIQKLSEVLESDFAKKVVLAWPNFETVLSDTERQKMIGFKLFMAEKYGEFFVEKEAKGEMKKFLKSFKSSYDKRVSNAQAADIRKQLLG